MKLATFTIARADTGAVLPYAIVTVYLSNGTTVATIYDNAGTMIPNPVTADINGSVSFAAANGTYVLRATSADGSISEPDITAQIFDLEALAQAIAAGGLASVVSVKYATKSAMLADLAPAANAIALVYGDSTVLNNDLYYKIGAGGSGSWSGTLGLLAGSAKAYSDLADTTRQRAQNAVEFATWADLAVATNMAAGDRATVATSDSGTHTDPVIGGAVSNAGVYLYSASPAGWQWMRARDSKLASDASAAVTATMQSAGSTGRPSGSNPITGNNLTPSRVIFNDKVTEDRTYNTLRIYIASGAPKTITLKRAVLTAAAFSYTGVGDLVVNVPNNGLNTIPISWDVAKGEFIGLETTTGGALTTTNTADGTGWYSSAGTPETISRTPAGRKMTTRLEIGLDYVASVVSATTFNTQKSRIDTNESAIADAARRALRTREYLGSASVLPILVGRNGGVALGYDTIKQTLVGPGLSSSSSTASSSAKQALKATAPTRTDWTGSVVYGESVADGTSANPAISTSAVYNCITFGSGVRSGKPGSTAGTVNNSPGTTTTRSLYEDNVPAWSGETVGETICSRMAKVAIEYGASKSGVVASGNIYFISNAGKGGLTITTGAKGTAPYQHLIDHITDQKACATAAGKTYKLATVELIIGQNNSSNGSRSFWSTSIRQLMTDIDTDARTITGQTEPVHFLCYQTSTNITTGGIAQPGGVARGWFDVVNQQSNAHFVTPYYFLPYADASHPKAIGQAWAGAYFGRAQSQLIDQQRKPDCLWPISAIARGTTLRVKFYVPTLPLTIDATTIGQATDNGFKVADDTGTLTLSGMYTDGDELVMTLNRELGTNPVFRAGLDYLGTSLSAGGGASTNLRDSTPDTTTISGTTYPLFHWCPHFDMTISTLEATS